jgi:hypothetical protein
MNTIQHFLAPTSGALAAVLMLCAGSAALFTGCGTTSGYKQADKTGAGIAEFRIV